MIDMHNHILVNVDDGPQSLKETYHLLKQAKQQGITGIVATPHHLNPRYQNEFEKVAQRVNELKTNITIQNLGIQIYPGQELRISEEIIKGLDDGTIHGLNKSKYLLIEFPFDEIPPYTQQLFYEIQIKGYIPVIANPERNKTINNNLKLLYELVNNGALSQLTTSALLGKQGRKAQKMSLRMIDCHLAHLIASDAHSIIERPFIMKDVLYDHKLISYQCIIEEMIKNASEIVHDRFIYLDRPIKPDRFKLMFSMVVIKC